MYQNWSVTGDLCPFFLLRLAKKPCHDFLRYFRDDDSPWYDSSVVHNKITGPTVQFGGKSVGE
jgi:hypothetical protein